MSLTEKWKTGELYGWFFCKILIENKEHICPVFISGGQNDFEIVEVLAPCDYAHFVELTEKVKKQDKELQQLKEKLDEALKSSAEFEEQLYYANLKLPEHKKNCCCLKNEKLRLDLSHRDNELRQKVDYIHELFEIKETYKKLLKECKEELEYHSELIFCELEGCNNAKIKFKSLLTRINASLGESEE